MKLSFFVYITSENTDLYSQTHCSGFIDKKIKSNIYLSFISGDIK